MKPAGKRRNRRGRFVFMIIVYRTRSLRHRGQLRCIRFEHLLSRLLPLCHRTSVLRHHKQRSEERQSFEPHNKIKSQDISSLCVPIQFAIRLYFVLSSRNRTRLISKTLVSCRQARLTNSFPARTYKPHYEAFSGIAPQSHITS